MGNVHGVNALATNQFLDFIPKGLNVVYGNNGAGKSGYIRLIKKITSSRHTEEILSNVFANNRGERTVDVEVEREGKSYCYQIDLDSDVTCKDLSNINIFDTLASNSYVTDSNTSSYQPLIISRLISFISVLDKIRDKLNRIIKENRCTEITLPKELENHIFFQDGLDYSFYNEKDIENIQFYEEDLHEAETILYSKNIDSYVENLSKSKKSLLWIIEYVQKIFESVNEKNIQFVNECLKKIEEESRILDIAKEEFSLTLGTDEKNEINTEQWKLMWKYVKEYFFMESMSDSFCPVCKQELDIKSSERLKNILNFIGHKSQENNKVIEASITNTILLKKADIIPEKELLLISSNLKVNSEEKLILDEFLTSLSMSAETLLNDEQKGLKNWEFSDDSINGFIEKTKERLHKTTKELELIQVKSKNDYFDKLRNDILDLKKKKFEMENKITILANIRKIEYTKKLKTIKGSVNTATTTTLVRKIAEKILASDYTEYFNEELRVLTNSKLQIILKKEKIKKGKIPFRLVVVNEFGSEFPPEKVFSEGERRVLSIAAFLADSRLNAMKGTIIMDDPVSSLDDYYENLVCKRLIEVSKERQMIIFTHRISLAYGLEHESKKMNVPFKEFSLRSGDNFKGIVSDGVLSKTKVRKGVNKLISEDIPKLKRLEPFSEEYDYRIQSITKEFRTFVEKTIEDVLTADVISRFDPIIHSNNVKNLAIISDKDCEIVSEMMSKYSYYSHSQSDQRQLLEIDLNELEEDISKYSDWLTKFNEKKKKRK